MQVLCCYMCTLPRMLHLLNIVVKYYRRSTVKWHTMAVYSCHRTIISPEFWSTALLRYGGHPYNTVFRMAITVYGTVESPTFHSQEFNVIRQSILFLLLLLCGNHNLDNVLIPLQSTSLSTMYIEGRLG